MSDNLVHLLYAGAFGKAVAGHFRKFRNDVTEAGIAAEIEVDRALWPPARMTIVASWRPLPKFCDKLDELHHELKRPFIPLIVDSTALRLGPVIIPGQGPCWRCWIQRSRQHAEWTNAQVALMKHYAEQPEAGPQGYLEPFAVIGAARLAQTVAEIDGSSARGGAIWQIDLLSREILTSTVVGVHSCSRCGLHRPEITRTVDQIKKELEYLWAERRGHCD